MPGSTSRWNSRAYAWWTRPGGSCARRRSRASPRRWPAGLPSWRCLWLGSGSDRAHCRPRATTGARCCADGSSARRSMALCGLAGGGAGCRAAGDPACARRVQGDAGQDRPAFEAPSCPRSLGMDRIVRAAHDGRARDRSADATWLVPAGALQVAAGAGNPGSADSPQAAPGQAARCGDEPARDLAWLRPEGGRYHGRTFETRIRELVAEHPTLGSIGDALLAAHHVLARELHGL